MLDPTNVRGKSQQELAKLGFEPPAHLPLIESSSELSPQSGATVATRACVLIYLVVTGYEGDIEEVNSSIDRYGLRKHLSDAESRILSGNMSQQDKINCTWQTECLQGIAWAMGLADINLMKHCDDDLATKFPPPFQNPRSFIDSARLRPFEEIYAMSDLHYLLHWYAREHQLSEHSIIREKRKTLDWIIGVDSDWDEIPLDT